MINCLQTRKGIIHYISWITGRGIYYTMCGKTYNSKFNRFNTYEIDASIPSACSNCQEMVSSFDEITSEGNRTVRGNLMETNVNLYSDVQKKYTCPEERYADLLDYRSWTKLRRMKISIK
jgi:hypothetical protein